MVLTRDVGHQSHEAPEAERRKLLVSQAQEGEESVGKAAELQRGARLLQLRRLAQAGLARDEQLGVAVELAVQHLHRVNRLLQKVAHIPELRSNVLCRSLHGFS